MRKSLVILKYFAFICYFSYSSCFAIKEKTIIYVYNGPGACSISVKHIIYTLEKLIDSSHHTIKLIGFKQVINENWPENTALFIMPGGADIPYLKKLSPYGNIKIRQFVENGGSYMGICAGSYYAGEVVEFAKNTEIEVVGTRELKFFSGIVRGPVLAEYDYNSCSGCRIAELKWELNSPFLKQTIFSSYYNGGGYFVDAEKKPNTMVLAVYNISGKFIPAIIEIKVGEGKAILSGVHWEYDPELLDINDPYLISIIPLLKKTNKKKLIIARHLLNRVGISTCD